MALTPTTQIELGFVAPSFSLLNVVTNTSQSYDSLKGKKGTLVMFICNHCPYVIHVRPELIRLANDYIPQGIGFIAISSNDIEAVPQDSPEMMSKLAKDEQFSFPYLYDERQSVAKSYDAACTPDFALFDASDICVYRGRLDDSRPGNDIALSGKDMRQALDNIIHQNPQEKIQYPSLGCNIKWKK